MMKLKVYGVNYNGVQRRIVAATSMRKAAVAIGTGYGHARKYGCETGNQEEIALAMREPGVVWSKAYRMGSEWVRV
jgi:hypothetical protein